MAKKRPSKERQTQPSIPAESALSFLKDTKGAASWSLRDLAETLKISRRDAEQVIAFQEAQGYIKRASRDEWMTSPEGASVSGAKFPRFTRESVERAVVSLKGHIQQVNQERKAEFRITHGVAFGDFLLDDRPRVQAADVGIALTQAGQTESDPHSATAAKAERQFLKQLRGKTALLRIHPYAAWMSKRSHLNLL
jgi:DNA-binding transcriptional MocR family regulator